MKSTQNQKEASEKISTQQQNEKYLLIAANFNSL